jgi:hypothetical protein
MPSKQDKAAWIAGHVLDSFQRERVFKYALQALEEKESNQPAIGTMECPICGKSEPHTHPELEQKGYIVALNISNEINRSGIIGLKELSRLCGYHLTEYERNRGPRTMSCQLCKAVKEVHPLPGCPVFITPGPVTADFFLRHETSYTQHKEWFVWECSCGEIQEERFKSWEECHKYTRDHWAGKLNELATKTPTPKET